MQYCPKMDMYVRLKRQTLCRETIASIAVLNKVSAMLVLRVKPGFPAAGGLDFGGKPFLTSRGINSNLLLTGPSTFSSVILRLVAFSCFADSLFEEVNSCESIREVSVVR